MITATAYDGYCEVRIVGVDFYEYRRDRSLFLKTIDSRDREHKPHKELWVVRNLTKYTRVPYIQKALLSGENQPKLF